MLNIFCSNKRHWIEEEEEEEENAREKKERTGFNL